jgi:hypothetical protein
MWIRHMAEVLRRGFEDVHGVEWPEEDRRYEHWFPGGRSRIYGSERPLDRGTATKPYVAFNFGLHTGSVVRWYVEGDTEFGAVLEALPDAAEVGIELINLKGSLETKSGAGLKFADALSADRLHRRFSIISFDVDEPNALRTIRQQIKSGKVVGYVSPSDPDFEFANFTVRELVEIAAQLDEEDGCSGDVLRLADWTGIANARAFEKRYGQLSETGRSLKGQRWGRALARHAFVQPIHAHGGSRPLLKTYEAALQSRIVHYDHQAAVYRIDPDSFALVRVADPGEPWRQ